MVCRETTMFRTVSHAEVQVTAGEAVRIVWAFLLAEGLKMRRGENFVETVLRYVSKLPFRKDVEITWIDVAIVFDDQIVAAVAAHRADGGAACGETRDDGIKKANGNGCDIVWIPCVEQLAEEVAPLAGLQGEGQGAVGVIIFDTFDILMVFETIIFQIVIDLGGISAVCFGNKREDICLDLMFFQMFQAVHDIRLTAATIDRTAVAVMKGGWAIETDAD